MKKELQPETYMRILSAKKIVSALLFNNEPDRSAINLRLDAGSGEAYNQILALPKFWMYIAQLCLPYFK